MSICNICLSYKLLQVEGLTKKKQNTGKKNLLDFLRHFQRPAILEISKNILSKNSTVKLYNCGYIKI